MPIKILTETWGTSDKSWLANRKGLDTMRSITVNITLFNALHYVNGYIPSGTVLGKVTATGLYGPYSPLLSNGLDVAAGILFDDVRVKNRSGVDYTEDEAALFWEGIVKESRLPTFTGAAAALGVIDAAGKTDLGNLIRWEA